LLEEDAAKADTAQAKKTPAAKEAVLKRFMFAAP
jgi:hypothetical protein